MLGPRKRLDLCNKSPTEKDKKFSSGKYRSFNLEQNLWKNLQYLWRHMTKQKVREKKYFRFYRRYRKYNQKNSVKCGYLFRKNIMLECSDLQKLSSYILYHIENIMKDTVLCGGRDSSVGIATRYELDGPGDRIPVGARFSAPVQIGPGAHPASCTKGNGSFQGGVDHPPPSSVEVEGRVELYICSGPWWPVQGRTLGLLTHVTS